MKIHYPLELIIDVACFRMYALVTNFYDPKRRHSVYHPGYNARQSDEIRELVRDEATLAQSDILIQALCDRHFIRRIGTHTSTRYVFTSLGFGHVESLLSNKESGLFKWIHFGPESLDAAIEPVVSTVHEDDVVSLSGREVLLGEISIKIKEITIVLREDNNIGGSLGEEKDRVRAEIEAGDVLLSSGTVRRSAVQATILRALKFIAEKFSGSAVGSLAEELIKLLAKALL